MLADSQCSVFSVNIKPECELVISELDNSNEMMLSAHFDNKDKLYSIICQRLNMLCASLRSQRLILFLSLPGQRQLFRFSSQ